MPHPGQQYQPGTVRNAAYLAHALQADQHPRLAELLAPDPAGHPASASPAGARAPDEGTPDRYADIMARILTGLLASA